MATQNIPVPLMNSKILDSLDRGEVKIAQDASTDYTRLQIREESFAFKILPPEKATDDMLTPALEMERLQILWEIEPDGPGSKWVPLQTIPDAEYITGSRYVIPFARLLTPKFVKDIDELRTTRQDIRKILTDNSIKDALAEYDSKFIDTVNSIVFDAPGAGLPQNHTGKVQWIDTSDKLDRQTFAEAKKLLPRGNANGKFRLRNYIALMNDVTAQDLLKQPYTDVGDVATETWKNGLTTDTVMGVKMIFTIKADLVPDNYVYFFAAPEFLGKAFYLTDWTMYMKKEAYFIEMFSYWLGGMAFGNVAAMAVARFNQNS